MHSPGFSAPNTPICRISRLSNIDPSWNSLVSDPKMALRRGLSGAALQRNRPSRSRLPLAVVISLSLLAPLIFFVGRGIYTIGEF
ncbi:hypothetical protein CK203_069745 [Vitis vinifera]|uniref:Uncharacterized protein n=1 Tax=Vitis vinifera TaxID=29760 RepID=A0A438E092_VITVI|nr:hypothetical protein CK203_069745 [Vitis vinifera]